MSPGRTRQTPPNVSSVDPRSFGGQLRKLREAAGMSQEELGEAIGLNQARVSGYERNQNMPSEEVLLNLAEVLNVAPGVLFEASRWRGALPVGPERRNKLMHASEGDWLLFDRVLDELGNVTPEQRREFERGFETFLRTWNES